MTALYERLTAPVSLLVVFLAACYGFYNRWTISVPPGGGGPSSDDLLLNDVASPQFFTYAALTTWLLCAIVRSGRDGSAEHLIRHGSYRRTATVACVRGLSWTAPVGAVTVLCWYLTALGLPTSAPAPWRSARAAVLDRAHVPLPVAIAGAFVLGLATLAVIHYLVVSTRLLLDRASVGVIVPSVVWVWFAASTAGLLPGDSVLSSAALVDVAAVVEHPATAVAAWVIVAILCALLGGALVVADRLHRGASFSWTPRRVFQSAVVLCVVLGVLGAPPARDPVERASFVLAGNGTALQVLVVVLIMVGYAFVFELELAELRRGVLLQQLLRYGSQARWGVRLLARELTSATRFLVVVLAVALTASLLSGAPPVVVPAGGSLLRAYHFLVDGVLQLHVYTALVFLASWMTGRATAGLVVVGALVVLGIAVPGTAPWLPVQLSGIWIVHEGWSGVLHATLTLALTLALLLAGVLLVFRLRRPVG